MAPGQGRHVSSVVGFCVCDLCVKFIAAVSSGFRGRPLHMRSLVGPNILQFGDAVSVVLFPDAIEDTKLACSSKCCNNFSIVTEQ